MSEQWTYEAGEIDPKELPPDPREAVESFARLDERARAPRYAFRAGPVTDCPLPYLDVQLHDEQGQPLAGVEVTLDFPEGGGRRGTTDEQGRAHFANVDVDTTTLEVELEQAWPAANEAPTYRARVHAGPATPRQESSPEDEAAGEPILYDRPYEVPVGLRHEPEDEEDEEALPVVTIPS